jgi:Flp pilus assembly protein TadD
MSPSVNANSAAWDRNSTGTAYESRLRSRAVIFLGLLLMGVCMAVITHVMTRVFIEKQRRLAIEWSHKGEAALKNGQQLQAVSDFQTALIYDRENSQYRLRLAQALIAAGQLNEARSHLLHLWEEKPGDGFINLELARLSAQQRDLLGVLRFYHAALYGLWDVDPERQRNQARLELIEFLLQHNENTQARAELIAFSSTVPNRIPDLLQLGRFFFQAQDYENALSTFQRALRIDRHNRELQGQAGVAAFDLGRFGTAAKYLRENSDNSDPEAQRRLETIHAIQDLSPYQRRLSERDQFHRIVLNFQLAGHKLQECVQTRAPQTNTAALAVQADYSQWQQLNSVLDVDQLQADPELMDRTMNLIFAIMTDVEKMCPLGARDTALLLIAKYREQVER